jgi:hypothetical protein
MNPKLYEEADQQWADQASAFVEARDRLRNARGAAPAASVLASMGATGAWAEDRPDAPIDQEQALPGYAREALNITRDFARMQEDRAGEYDQIKSKISETGQAALEGISQGIDFALQAAEIPLQGYQGIAATLASLATGGDLNAALNTGANAATIPFQEQQYNSAGAVVDAMSQNEALRPYAPAAGAALYTGTQLLAPF